ncbi:MAG TPA: glycosyltransferase family 39 protein [Phycisphaerae bacterium]|nr:glycosyltransferase family 39 protein [Phycisphaerae bacterium]
MSRKRAPKKHPQPSPRKTPTGLAPASKGLARACDIAAGAIAGIMLISVIHMSREPVTWPQDSFSDMHTLLAGENFKRHGLLDMRFLPVHYAGPEKLGEWRRYYTHYPPLPDVVNGIVRLVGIDSLSGMRIVSGLFGIAGFVLMYGAIRLAVHPLAGAIGLAFIAGSGYFWSYGVSVHQHPFNIFFVGLFLAFFVRAADQQRRIWPWAGCWGALMLASLSSFEFIMYPQVFAWAYVLITGRLGRHWKALLILATAPIAGVALHYLQNVWALGWAGAWADKLGYGQYGGESRWEALAKLPKMLSDNIDGVYRNGFPISVGFGWPWYVLVLLVAVVVAVIALKRDDGGRWRKALALLGAASVAPWAWYLIMAAHAHHPHTINQLVPLVMIGSGSLGALIAMRLFAPKVPAVVRALMAAGALVLLAMVYGNYSAVGARLRDKPPSPFMQTLEALGPAAFPERSAALFNITPEAHLAYFLRDYSTLCPRRELEFPGDLRRLNRCLPEGWSYSSYLYFVDDQRWLFELLATHCRGRVLEYDAGEGRVQRFPIVLFDISPLLAPLDKRRLLPPDVAEAQKAGRFPPWHPPGFDKRFRQALTRIHSSAP